MNSSSSAKKPSITPKQAKIVKRKVQAVLNDEPQRKIARELYPNATQGSAEVSVSRELKKANVKEALEIALAKHGITPDSIVGVVAEGMKANRVVQVEGDFYETEVADHSIRLKASGMAANFMGLGKQEGSININFNAYAQEQREKYQI